MAKVYYYIDSENLADNSFSTKSVWSFFTLGTARAVYILIVYPIMALHARLYVISKMRKEKIVSGFPSSYGYHDFQMQKYITKCLEKGTILENKSTVEENTQISGQKIASGKPTKFIPKLAEVFTSEGRYRKKQRERNYMTNFSEKHAWVYIDGSYFLKCQQTFSDFMSSQGTLSIVDIVQGLKNANLITEISGKSDAEVKFFVAFVLDKLVLFGKLVAEDYSDDVFDNRQYRHIFIIPHFSCEDKF